MILAFTGVLQTRGRNHGASMLTFQPKNPKLHLLWPHMSLSQLVSDITVKAWNSEKYVLSGCQKAEFQTLWSGKWLACSEDAVIEILDGKECYPDKNPCDRVSDKCVYENGKAKCSCPEGYRIDGIRKRANTKKLILKYGKSNLKALIKAV